MPTECLCKVFLCGNPLPSKAASGPASTRWSHRARFAGRGPSLYTAVPTVARPQASQVHRQLQMIVGSQNGYGSRLFGSTLASRNLCPHQLTHHASCMPPDMENMGFWSLRRKRRESRAVAVSPCRRECASTMPRRSCRRRSWPRCSCRMRLWFCQCLTHMLPHFPGSAVRLHSARSRKCTSLFQEYIVEEWLDWIYQLQTNHVLLTPEYTCVRLRGFLGCHVPNPRTHQASTSFVDSRKLRSDDKQVISPGLTCTTLVLASS